jgi:hypothetical protein
MAKTLKEDLDEKFENSFKRYTESLPPMTPEVYQSLKGVFYQWYIAGAGAAQAVITGNMRLMVNELDSQRINFA